MASMSKQQLRAIVKADNARRAQRTRLEDAILGIDVVDSLSDQSRIAESIKQHGLRLRVNPCIVRGIGTVNPPLPIRATEDCWTRGMRGRTVGTADGKTASVKVTHADGASEVLPVAHFRGKRDKQNSRPRSRTAPQMEHRTTAADLPRQVVD